MDKLSGFIGFIYKGTFTVLLSFHFTSFTLQYTFELISEQSRMRAFGFFVFAVALASAAASPKRQQFKCDVPDDWLFGKFLVYLNHI